MRRKSEKCDRLTGTILHRNFDNDSDDTYEKFCQLLGLKSASEIQNSRNKALTLAG